MIPRVYDGTVTLDDPDKMGAGPMDGPKGITIHYTADVKIPRVINSLRDQGLGYHILVGRTGKITQTAYFDQRVHHAGLAEWRGNAPNKTHISVALASWGKVKKIPNKLLFRSWNNTTVSFDAVLKRTSPKGHVGYWHKCTKRQYVALMEFLCWAVDQGLDPRDVCGHDECAVPAGRKIDPGGILSVTMPEMRAQLQANHGIEHDWYHQATVNKLDSYACG